VEDLLDGRHGVTVLHQDVDLVIADREGGQGSVARGQQTRSLTDRGRENEDGERPADGPK
jgi:hypothetical protein